MDFFILGNPRSGTTLLRLMLNNHSRIGVPPESGFLQWWFAKYSKWNVLNTSNNKDLDSFLNNIFDSKKIEDWKLNKRELKAFIIKVNPKNYIEIIDCIYLFYCKKKYIIGDKNNYYIHHLEELKLISPKAKYLHLVRDGRDVACSYIKINKLDQNLRYLPKVSSNIEEIAKEWNQNLTKIENFISNNNSLTIRYEDLISDTKTTLKKVCVFLDMEFEENMLHYYLKSNNDEPSSTIHWKKKTLKTVDGNNKNKYLQLLSDTEIKKFNAIAITNLKKFHYD